LQDDPGSQQIESLEQLSPLKMQGTKELLRYVEGSGRHCELCKSRKIHLFPGIQSKSDPQKFPYWQMSSFNRVILFRAIFNTTESVPFKGVAVVLFEDWRSKYKLFLNLIKETLLKIMMDVQIASTSSKHLDP
jgi:hypothetical protein